MESRLLALLLVCSVLGQALARVTLRNNGYEGVVISIGASVPEDKRLIQRLEEFLTLTSATMFKATRQQLYFREFTVVLPQNWTAKPYYQNAIDSDVEHAEFIVDKANPAYGNAPYVKQYAECGLPGLYIHLTPQYLLDDAITFRWGLPEKTLVHEWAHLRWGLFDEYPIDPEDARFYRHDGHWEPVRCTREVEGVLQREGSKEPCLFNPYTGEPEPGCKFLPRMKNNKAWASIMFMQYLESIAEFCDDPYTASEPLRHNQHAPNRQNRLCQYRSAWEVMKKHEDFKGKKYLPYTTDTTPKFRFVQVRPRRRVLVLDTSGSMTGPSLNILRQAASNYILNSVETGSWLGIVEFNTEAAILSPLVEIKSDLDRQVLLDRLPTKAVGKTSIGSGLFQGLNVLLASKTGMGGTLILITDGKENMSPWIKDIRQDLLKHGIMIHAFAYGQQAEQEIAQLAQATGGRTFFFSGLANSTALIDGLAATVQQQTTVNDDGKTGVSILTTAKKVTQDTPVAEEFYIDSGIGLDTILTFTYTEAIDVTLHGPDSVFSNETHPEVFRHSPDNKLLILTLPGQAKAGKWQYNVTTASPSSSVNIHIQSKPAKPGTDVIVVRSWISSDVVEYDVRRKIPVYATVLRGKAPVLSAKVMATIEREDFKPITLELRDTGVGSDLFKNDGVYSAYVMASDIKGDGRYAIKVKVHGDEDKTKVVVNGNRMGALERGISDQPGEVETTAVEYFERVSAGGEFRVSGYVASDVTVDVIAPSRIPDLRLATYHQDSGKATLHWTAVGDDLDRGTAYNYEVLLAKQFDHIVRNDSLATLVRSQDVLRESRTSLTSPRAAGENEVLILNVSLSGVAKNQTLYLGVRAVDKAGNKGDISNVVYISYVEEADLARNRPSGHTFSGIAVPWVAGSLGFVVALTLLFLIWCRRPRSKKITDDKGEGHSSGSYAVDLGIMNYMCDGEYRKRWEEGPTSWEVK